MWRMSLESLLCPLAGGLDSKQTPCQVNLCAANEMRCQPPGHAPLPKPPLKSPLSSWPDMSDAAVLHPSPPQVEEEEVA